MDYTYTWEWIALKFQMNNDHLVRLPCLCKACAGPIVGTSNLT